LTVIVPHLLTYPPLLPYSAQRYTVGERRRGDGEAEAAEASRGRSEGRSGGGAKAVERGTEDGSWAEPGEARRGGAEAARGISVATGKAVDADPLTVVEGGAAGLSGAADSNVRAESPAGRWRKLVRADSAAGLQIMYICACDDNNDYVYMCECFDNKEVL